MSAFDDLPWEEVPEQYLPAWRAIFKSSHETLDLAAACPVCNKTSLHRWYQVGRPIDISVDGNHFVARGNLWEWCHSCGSFVHYSANVPDWWLPPSDLDVDETSLRVIPWAIEEARRKREEELANRRVSHDVVSV